MTRNTGNAIEAHDLLLLTPIDPDLPMVDATVPGGGRVFISTSPGFEGIATPPPVDLSALIGTLALPDDIDAPGNDHWQALDLEPPADPGSVTWVAAYVPRLINPQQQ